MTDDTDYTEVTPLPMLVYDRCPRCKSSVLAWIQPNIDDTEGDEHIKCRNCGADLVLSWTCDIDTSVRLDNSAEPERVIDPNQQALTLDSWRGEPLSPLPVRNNLTMEAP